jgi:hypothetical protein
MARKSSRTIPKPISIEGLSETDTPAGVSIVGAVEANPEAMASVAKAGLVTLICGAGIVYFLLKG